MSSTYHSVLQIAATFKEELQKCVGVGIRGAERRESCKWHKYKGAVSHFFLTGGQKGKKNTNLSALVDSAIHNCTLLPGKLWYMLPNQFPWKRYWADSENSQGLRRPASMSGVAHLQLLLIPAPSAQSCQFRFFMLSLYPQSIVICNGKKFP